MTLALTVALGLLIGAVLGALGGGGAILTVPALVYLVGQPAQEATTSSLVIVGLTAAVGMASYLSSHRVRWGLGLTFGIVGFPATWLGSYFNHRVDQHLVLLGFSVLMIAAAAAMVGDRPRNADTAHEATKSAEPGPPRPAQGSTHTSRVTVLERSSGAPASRMIPSPVAVVLVALAVGLLTGFFGVGGGFVVVPALVLVLRLPMHLAVGTSLMIVALNSSTSLVARAGTAHFDWGVIIPFTVAAMVATLAGKRVAERVPARRLKLSFAALLVLVAGYTAWQSIDGLLSSDASANSPAATSGSIPTT
ncbi:MAG: sulfite exporter TauE/SafE family protein [Nocardioides sp.]